MTRNLGPNLRPVVRLALSAVLRNPDEHLDAYLARGPAERSLDHAEASGIGVDLVPEVVALVEWAWLLAQHLADEHETVVGIAAAVVEGALGNELHGRFRKPSIAPPPPKADRLTEAEVEAVARKVADLLARMATTGRAAPT